MYYADDNNNNEKILKVVERTLELLKHLGEYEFRTSSINKAITSNEHQLMVQTINKKWRELKDFANKLTPITKYHVYDVDKDFYDDKSIDYLVNQLKDIKIFVALKLLMDKASKELIKKVLKEFGIATDEQLKKMF